MDLSNTPLTGKELLNKSARKEGERFKVDYLLKHKKELNLLKNGYRHIEFINNLDNRLNENKELSEAQVKYLDSLFEQIFGGDIK